MEFNTSMNDKQQKSEKNIVWVAYGLAVAGLFMPIVSIIGAFVILAYIKRGDCKGTIYENHLRYLIKTFCGAFIGSIIGVFTVFVLVGWLILFAITIWYIYRLIAGALKFNDGQFVDLNKWI